MGVERGIRRGIRRGIKGLLAGVGLVGLIATAAFGISDMGSPNVTRLWGGEDSKFGCSASYVRSPYDNTVTRENTVYILSAGHCADAGLHRAKRGVDDTFSGYVNWYVTVLAGGRGTDIIDFAFGSVPDVRDIHTAFWLGEKFPSEGLLYIHSFPLGVEKVTEAFVLPADDERIKSISDLVPGSRLVAVPVRAVQPGSSGAPILDSSGRVVGVVWGLIRPDSVPDILKSQGLTIVAVTPIERVLDIVKSLAPRKDAQ